MARLVVVDNDCGIDDAWALNFILNFDKDLKVLAITCVNGNTSVDNVCNNNLYFLKTAGRSEIPVYRGAECQIMPIDELRLAASHNYFHGKNGFGDVKLPSLNDIGSTKEGNAITRLHEITSEHKGAVSIICLGPLTNIALTLRVYPSFKENVKDLFIMGGNYTGKGNITMAAEFNFHSDPEAAFIVLSELGSKVVLLPWETCLDVHLPFEWREELGKSGGKVMSLLNKIEEPIMLRTKELGYKHWISADQLLAALYIDRTLITDSEKVYATVELAGSYTRGQVVIDHLKIHEPNILLVKKIDIDLYKQMLLKLRQY